MLIKERLRYYETQNKFDKNIVQLFKKLCTKPQYYKKSKTKRPNKYKHMYCDYILQ